MANINGSYTISNNSGSTTDFITNDLQVTISGTFDAPINEAQDTLEILVGGVPYTLANGDIVISGGGTIWTLSLPVLSDGSYLVSVSYTPISDGVPQGFGYSFTIDTVAAPTPAITAGISEDSGTPGDNITNDTTPTISGTAEPDSSITIWDGDSNGSFGTTKASSSGVWTWTFSTLNPGNFSIKTSATDVAGNAESSRSDVLLFTIDNVAAPTPSIIAGISTDSGVTDDEITNDTTPTISGTAEANATVTIYTNDSVTPTGTATADVSGVWTYTFSALTAGDYSVKATATDVAGNTESALSSALLFTVDNVAAPTPSITAGISTDSGVADDEITNDTTPTISGTAEANATVTIYTNGSVTPTGTATANGSGDWTYTFSASKAGDYSVKATATDVAGNTESALSSALLFTIDNVAPILTISSSPTTISAGQSTKVTFSFNESPGTSFDVSDIDYKGGTLSNFSGSGTTYTATFTADENSNSGTAEISVGAESFSDAAGNMNVFSTAEITIGNSAPTTSNKTATMLEDDDYIFSTADFSFSDVNKADTLQFIKITSLPSDGNLVFNESAAYKGQEIAVNRLNELIFSPYANDNGTGYASFAFMVSDGEAYSESSANWSVNVTPVNDAPEGSVSISGKNNVGQTLGTYISIDEPDGIVGNLRYQWLANDIIIRGAISSTYKLITADVGKTIKVVVSYLDGDGFTESFTSSATLPIANLNNAPTGTVKITGTAIQGATLTASNTIMDLDGIGEDTFAPSNPISYQWKANGVIINDGDSDHDDSTFVLSQEQVNKKITVEAIYEDNQGNAEKVSSTTTALVRNVNDAPTGGIVISDSTPQVGQTLTIINTVGDLDGLPTKISYQWTADGVVIRGAASTSYIVRSSDLGKEIKVIMTYTDMLGMTERVESNPTEDVTQNVPPIAPVNPPPSGFSSMSSLLWAGQLLESSSSGSSSASEHGHQYQDSVVDMIGIANSELALF